MIHYVYQHIGSFSVFLPLFFISLDHRHCCCPPTPLYDADAMLSFYVCDIARVDVAYVFWLPPNDRSKHRGPDPERGALNLYASCKLPCSHSLLSNVHIHADPRIVLHSKLFHHDCLWCLVCDSGCSTGNFHRNR